MGVFRMRVIAFIVTVLLATAVLLGGVSIVVLETPDAEPWLGPFATLALTTLIYGPLVLGSLNAYWDVRRTEASRRSYRWWLGIVVGVEVLAAVAIVVFAVVAGAQLWIPVLFIGGGAVLLVVALVAGRWLGRREQRHPLTDRPLAVMDRRQFRRRVLIVALVFVVGMAVGLLACVLIALAADEPLAPLLSFAFQVAFLAATLAALLVARPLNLALRESAGRDLGLMRRLSRVVLRGKHDDLTADEQAAAVRYAVVAPQALGFQLAAMTLLYIALLLQYLRTLLLDDASAFYTATAVILVAVMVVYYPILIVRIRRASRYAEEHASALDAAVEAPDAVTDADVVLG